MADRGQGVSGDREVAAKEARASAVNETRELAAPAERKVTAFYGLDRSIPVSVALDAFEIARFGLLPWARSGLRKTVIVRHRQVTSAQIAHEMSHYCLRHVSGGRAIPLWFDEGLACYVGGTDLGGGTAELKRALRNREVPDITRWTGLRGKLAWLYRMYVKRQTHTIYGLSQYLVERLVEKHGLPKLRSLVAMLGETEFDVAFAKSYGRSARDFCLRDAIPALSGA